MTKWFCLFLLVIGLAYDFWVLSKFGREASISAVVSDAAKEYVILAVIAGILIGHWFFPVR